MTRARVCVCVWLRSGEQAGQRARARALPPSSCSGTAALAAALRQRQCWFPLMARHTRLLSHIPPPPLAVFTFVRNPWARAISSWKHVNSRGVKRECQQSFAEYARLPSAYGAVCLAK